MKKRWMISALLLFSFLAGNLSIGLAAKNYDLKQITPEIQQAIDGRRSRFKELRPLKEQGTIGENNQGLIEVLKGGNVELATAENRDRMIIYQAIVDQNHLGAGGLSEVKKAFADVKREKAHPGDFIQSPSGNWNQK